METFEFSVVASGLDPEADDYEARFYDGGCDDALVSFQKGYTIVDFAREAEAIDEAIASAVEGVAAAGANVERIEPDPLVSLAEIAARSELTRAAISQYVKGQRGGGGFPPPVARVTSASPLWAWSDVSRWLYERDKLTLDAAVHAAVVAEANKAVAAGDRHMRARLRACREDYRRAA